MNLYKEFLEVGFLDESVHAVIILIGIGKMHSIENTSLHEGENFMSAHLHVSSCYLFFLLPIC